MPSHTHSSADQPLDQCSSASSLHSHHNIQPVLSIRVITSPRSTAPVALPHFHSRFQWIRAAATLTVSCSATIAILGPMQWISEEIGHSLASHCHCDTLPVDALTVLPVAHCCHLDAFGLKPDLLRASEEGRFIAGASDWRVSGPGHIPADKMPIYCINSTGHSRKKSKSLIHEVIGASNYYINNNSQPPLSTASQHVLSCKVASANKSASTSLIMAINRFKNSVKDMKDTVLIPTRLSDLTQQRSEELSEAASEVGLENSESLGCCAPFSSNNLTSIALSSVTQLSPTESNYSTNSPGGTLLSHHNLYEQYKLLDLIDKILSSDTVVTVSNGHSHGGYKRHHNGSPFALSNGVDNDDNNNKHGSEKESVDESITTLEHGRTEPVISTGGAVAIDNRRELNGKTVNFATVEANHELSVSNNEHIDAYHTALPDCSLIKIKEKLEYHLVSLKNILNVMSNSAEYITQTYLEDIHCEDRFSDKQAKLSETNESNAVVRHYYTSGGASGGGGGSGPTAGF